MTKTVGCTAPKEGHEPGSAESKRCPVHGAGIGAVAVPSVVSAPPMSSARIEERQVFDSPLPGVLGDLEDWGVIVEGGKDDSDMAVLRRLVSRIANDRWLVVESRFTVIELSDTDDYWWGQDEDGEDDLDQEAQGPLVSTYREQGWILCEDPADPLGTSVAFEADEGLWGQVDTDFTNFADANKENLTKASELWSEGAEEVHEFLLSYSDLFAREAKFARNLEAAGIRRKNTAAIDYLAGIGTDLRTAESVDPSDAEIALRLHPDPAD